MNDIKTRLAALETALELRKLEREWPMDDLSKSLYEMGLELAALDTLGKSALVDALNSPDDGGAGSLNLTLEDINRMIADWRGNRCQTA